MGRTILGCDSEGPKSSTQGDVRGDDRGRARTTGSPDAGSCCGRVAAATCTGGVGFASSSARGGNGPLPARQIRCDVWAAARFCCPNSAKSPPIPPNRAPAHPQIPANTRETKTPTPIHRLACEASALPLSYAPWTPESIGRGRCPLRVRQLAHLAHGMATSRLVVAKGAACPWVRWATFTATCPRVLKHKGHM